MSLESRRNQAIASGVAVATNVFAKSARNAEIWDTDGARYIDFAAGIAVVNTGHCHPKLVDAVQKQLGAFTHTCHQVVPYESYVALAERLNAAVPGDGAKKTCFVTTGAEACENAIKIARAATGRNAVVAFSGAFHGRTFLGMSMTGKVQPYKYGFGAMMPDVHHVPYPNPLHGVSPEDALQAMERLFKSDVAPDNVAAIIIEPVQGEGGFYPAPAGFLRSLRKVCDENGIVLIADEVQTGFARTGTLFAMEQSGVAADLTTMAKGLAGGLPLAAVVGKAELMDAPGPGGLGGTYAGNPLAIAAAHAVLDIIEEENLCARANRLGESLRGTLTKLGEKVPQIAEVRGPGFMTAVEFFDLNGTPDAVFANQVREEALKHNLILLTCGVYGNVIRFLAPLTLQDEVFAEAVAIIEDAILTTAAARLEKSA